MEQIFKVTMLPHCRNRCESFQAMWLSAAADQNFGTTASSWRCPAFVISVGPSVKAWSMVGCLLRAIGVLFAARTRCRIHFEPVLTAR